MKSDKKWTATSQRPTTSFSNVVAPRRNVPFPRKRPTRKPSAPRLGGGSTWDMALCTPIRPGEGRRARRLGLQQGTPRAVPEAVAFSVRVVGEIRRQQPLGLANVDTLSLGV